MDLSIKQLPAGFRMRAPLHEDAEAVVQLLRACDVAIFGEPDTDIKDVRDEWAAPGFDLARDAWILERADGVAAGFACVWRRTENDFDGSVRVLPGESLGALAPVLLEAVEGRVRDIAAGRPASLCFFTASVETEMRSLLERSGYREARTYLRMRIDLPPVGGSDVSPEGSGLLLLSPRGKTSLPPSVQIRPMRLGEDDRAIHAAIEESFAEHFRHTTRSLEEWWALRARHERFDPGLWLLARDGEQVAGAMTAYDFGDLGFIRELGVLKPWRGRGLGSALLARSFEAFRARGQLRVALGVDAENEGAVGLYERIGMRVESRHHLLRRRVGT